MADFCNQCAVELGFEPGDMANITKQEDWEKGLAAVVLCEDCGPILVDPHGNCVTECDKKHRSQRNEGEGKNNATDNQPNS